MNYWQHTKENGTYSLVADKIQNNTEGYPFVDIEYGKGKIHIRSLDVTTKLEEKPSIPLVILDFLKRLSF